MANIYDKQLTELEKNQAQEATWLDEKKKTQENQIQAEKDAAVAEINRQKAEADTTLSKTKNAAYVDYMKAINPYGTNRETAVEQGLGRAGYSESTQANYFNSYQTAVSTAIESTNKIKADYDAQINQAILSANSSLAELATANYEQQITNMWNAYQMKVDIQNNQQSAKKSSSGSSGNSGINITDTPTAQSKSYSAVSAALELQKPLLILNKTKGKETMGNILNTAYSNGKITQAELEELATKYGL